MAALIHPLPRLTRPSDWAWRRQFFWDCAERRVYIAGQNFAFSAAQSSLDFKSLRPKSAIGKQRQSQVPHPHQDDRLQAVGAQKVRRHPGQLPDIVAQAAGAELAKVSQVLAKLGGFDAGGPGQGIAETVRRPLALSRCRQRK